MRTDSLFLPLGPMYLIERLRQEEYEVTFLDGGTAGTADEVVDALRDDTIAVGVSTMSGSQLKNALDIVRHVRRRAADIPIIWGGVHVTALPEQSLRAEEVDYIVWGEGEGPFITVLDALRRERPETLHGVAGVGCKTGGKYVIGANSGYTDMGRTFHLPYDMLEMDRYRRKMALGAEREYPVWTSRGCPFSCTFCSNSSEVWSNRRVRLHTLDHIVNDIGLLVERYGADMITFADENFLLKEERLLAILEALRQAGISVKSRFAARVDLLVRLSEGTWEKMRDYGVVGVGAAPESASQNVLDYMGKGITVEQIRRLDALLTRYGFKKSYNFLVGVPRETKADLKETLKMMCHLAETSLDSPYPIGTLHKYIPLPGTKMYEDAKNFGFTPPDSLEGWTTFDFSDVPSSLKTVRPWFTPAYYDYVGEATELIERLNRQLNGRDVDTAAVGETVTRIERLIAH
jgi:radical SAM superfamily enzyme YgiQ (UPF0313 family)